MGLTSYPCLIDIDMPWLYNTWAQRRLGTATEPLGETAVVETMKGNGETIYSVSNASTYNILYVLSLVI